MKYIKDFNKFDIKKLKKFIVSQESNIYFLDELMGISGTNLKLKEYCTYDIDRKKFQKKTQEVNNLDIRYLDNIEYSANTYDDCYDYLKIIIDVDKYNI